MSIRNPGPNNKHITVMYQNVQGLIPIKDLGNKNPSLNLAKISELQSHIYEEKFDIVVLNETWLTKNIHNNEILAPDAYHIFRADRNESTHPTDPQNSTKFRKNGGGVLIAIKTSLDIKPKK